MSLTINTNTAATFAAGNLNNSNAMLQKSLARLSSGSKITSPADDAGGLAVSLHLEAAMARTDATSTSLENATSYLQVQDGDLKNTGAVLQRIAELKTLSQDVTKSAGDVANYDAEFTTLKAQLTSMASSSFNGVPVFKAGGGTLTVPTSEDGSQTMTITQTDYNGATTAVSGAANLGALTGTQIDTAITAIATARAQNGAEDSRLGFSIDMLSINKENLEAANSRIVDTDVAAESTRLAKNNILVQAGSAMLAQANSSQQSILKLLQ